MSIPSDAGPLSAKRIILAVWVDADWEFLKSSSSMFDVPMIVRNAAPQVRRAHGPSAWIGWTDPPGAIPGSLLPGVDVTEHFRALCSKARADSIDVFDNWDRALWTDDQGDWLAWQYHERRPAGSRLCPDCNGAKVYRGLSVMEPCRTCQGTGEVTN